MDRLGSYIKRVIFALSLWAISCYSVRAIEVALKSSCNIMIDNVVTDSMKNVCKEKKISKDCGSVECYQKEVDIPMLVENINRFSLIDSEQYLAQDSIVYYRNVKVEEYLKKNEYRYSVEDLIIEYEQLMVALSETEDADSLLMICLGALSTGIEILQPMACEGIVQVMAYKGNITFLKSAIQRFEMVTSSEEANELYSFYDDILNPRSFTDLVTGTWVSPNLISTSPINKSFPYYMLRIHSLDKNNGIELLNIPGETTHLVSADIASLRFSQMIGGEDGYIEASFGSELFKRGNSEFAKSGFETTREFRAQSRATISSSKASFGEKIAATAATELFAGLLDGAFSSTAQSYKHVAALNINMTMKSPLVMNANAQYYNYTINTSYFNYTPTPIQQKDIMLVKWEPEDSVYFVDSKNRIFSVSSRSQLDLSEYNSIMERYSFRKPRYFLPSILGACGGLSMMVGGIVMVTDFNIRDEYGNQLYEQDGSKKVNMSKLIGGIFLIACGEVVAISIPVVVSQKRTSKRDKALRELNEQQAHKLSQKGIMSISPMVNPSDGVLGMSTTITF